MELKERTRLFARRVIHLSAALPQNRIGDVIGRQIVKSGTSPGAHFREATRARSKAEYVSKLNGGLMELEETLYWLEIIRDEQLVVEKKLSPLITEADEAHLDFRLAHQEVEEQVNGSISAFCSLLSDFQ